MGQPSSRLLAGIVAAIVVAGITYVAYNSAVAGTQLYLRPAAAKVADGSIITVQVRENSRQNPVNAVQANLAYNPAQLQYVSTDYSNSAFGMSLPSTAGEGSVKIIRSINFGKTPPTGDNLIATVNFKPLVKGGVTSRVSFGAGSEVVRSSDNVNILKSSGWINYVLR